MTTPLFTRLRLAVVGILSPLLPACAQSHSSAAPRMLPYQTEKFKLSAGPCTVAGYWVTLQGGYFRNSQGKGFPVPSGHTLRGSWGASGTSWLVGDAQQAVPERLKLLWFAYAEDKFYEGEFVLPQEKLYHLLKQGYWDTDKNKPGTYTEFTVCVVPKGGAFVWLTGGNQTLVGRYQAHEVFPSALDYQRYYGRADRASMVKDTQAELPAEVQAQIKAGTISAKQWDEYLTTYPWQVAFNVPFVLDRPHGIHYLNAEHTIYPLTRDLAAYAQTLLTPVPKPVPISCVVRGRAEHRAHYVVLVRAFDQAETQAAFQTLHQLSPTSPITLLFTLDKPYQKATMLLQNDRKQIPLTQSVVEVLSED